MEGKSKTRSRTPLAGGGFDVVCTIGTVRFSETGEDHPHVAAIKLIAEHNAPGLFTFPMEDGRECRVAVDYVP